MILRHLKNWPERIIMRPMVRTPAAELSDELCALFSRAELATAEARRLLDENDRWRQSVQQQLDFMFELSAEFRRPQRITYP